MLIVYEDEMALEEADEKPLDGFPSYYHSGLTPPMKRVVERRFAAREHKASAPPRMGVIDVEGELLELMDKLSKDEKTKRKNKVPTLTSATKVLEEVDEEVVDYEPWMDDYGRQPSGVEFDADDQLCSLHPEVWLNPDVISSMRDEQQESDRKKKKAVADKKEKKAARKKEKQAKAEPSVKKGIAAKKNRSEIDEVTEAAASMMAGDNFDIMELGDDDLFDLNLDDDEGIKFDDLKL